MLDLPPSINLAEWRHFLSTKFSSIRTTEAKAPDFQASFLESNVGSVQIYGIESNPHTLERSPQLIGPESPHDVKFYLQLSGTTIIEQSKRTTALKPGQLTLFVTYLPYTIRFPTAQQGLLVKVPTSVLPHPESIIESLALTILDRKKGIGSVLLPSFSLLGNRLEEDPNTVQAVECLLEAVVYALIGVRQADRPLTHDSTFEKATEFIDRHLSDPSLNAEGVAKALYISLRSLQKHFADHELTVTKYIKSRRVHLIRRDLANPAFSDLSIREIAQAHGLTQPSHISRIFKEEFGISPRVFRSHLAD